ncbi:hypothetical protein LTS08_005974 [Lithohypha guttulata]|uniref:uncharacterized protein n=1 Tax=Lithohypha guttulata TaxID=1690604 RepID=UPI002DDEFD01|nr:hypothetical protein LTR51_002489 [Lithohypha guttulata]KAK5099392.1 hypothetical protein LTS08_005974 [Lithohypha guttulata]
MATNVVVIDSTARRAIIKTNPGMYLSDVLQQASQKLGIPDASQYGLRHNNKQLDLSRSIRLSGLTSGAKLEAVQLSKSAGVVSVALQLPQSEATAGQARLTDKFPSTTTLWQVLRQFEAGAAGSGSKRNLTARGAPSTGSGAGRLYYEQPVLHVIGRDLASFTDLQKTLAQLGLNNGSVLIKLSYKISEEPLEDAMTQIQAYFKEVDPQPTQAEALAQMKVDEEAAKKEPVKPEWLDDHQMQDVQPTTGGEPQLQATESTSESVPPTTTVSDRPVSIYRPPTDSAPVTTSYNEADYVPTVEHAQKHQERLLQESRNKRLPTDAEILAKQKEQREQLQKIESIEIKVRFPDQSAISCKFGQDDTAATLYRVVRDHLNEKLKSEPFVLSQPGVRDKSGGILSENDQKLIMHHQFKGRVLVVFAWDEAKASVEARGIKQVLKPEVRQQAQEYVPPQLPQLAAESEDSGTKIDLGSKKQEKEETGSKSKVPKWLRMGKK